jgi:hypothetical protein
VAAPWSPASTAARSPGTRAPTWPAATPTTISRSSSSTAPPTGREGTQQPGTAGKRTDGSSRRRVRRAVGGRCFALRLQVLHTISLRGGLSGLSPEPHPKRAPPQRPTPRYRRIRNHPRR